MNDIPHIVSEPDVELTVATTGYSATVELPDKFGREGRITNVKVRESNTLNKGTAATFIIAHASVGDIGAGTTDSEKCYESDSTAFSGSATVAELIEGDAVFGTAAYSMAVDEKLKIAINVTAAAGGGASSKFYATVEAEVYR